MGQVIEASRKDMHDWKKCIASSVLLSSHYIHVCQLVLEQCRTSAAVANRSLYSLPNSELER
jgi:hypothetical protein